MYRTGSMGCQTRLKNLSSTAGTLAVDVKYVAQGTECMWRLKKSKDGPQSSLFYDSGDVVGQLGQWLDDLKTSRSTMLPVGTGTLVLAL